MADLSRLDRRTVLRAGAALALGGPSALAACSDDTGSGSPTVDTVPSTSSPPPASTSVTTTTTYDPDIPYWLQGGFAPVFDEVSTTELVVEGSLPPSLHGLYVRNGSNPATGSSPHWFFGDGMVHGLRFENGAATWYGNRWVETPYLEARAGFTDLGPPGAGVTQSNVSVFQHGGRLLSLGEVGWPYELDPSDLSTVGPVEITGPAGVVGGNVTAHPKRDPQTGLLHFFGYGFTPPFLTYYVASPDGQELIRREEIAVGAPTMIHDFAITEADVVFWELPVLFDIGAAVAGSTNPFVWTPDYGSRIGVMPLAGSAADMTWVDIENGYVFHGTNAHRDGDRIVLDVSRMPRMFAVDEDDGTSLLTRWEVDLGGGAPTWSETTLHDVPMDLPEIDERVVGRPHTVAWLVETNGTLEGNLEFNGVARFDVATGATDRWTPGPALQPNEVLFVPDSPDAAEGEGWLLTFVWDRATDSSVLAVLDATDVGAGPVATVGLPQRVPFGFHATWVPGPV